MADAKILTKFATFRDALQTELIERTSVIDSLILAFISKKHMFQLGEPGVAKSLSYEAAVGHIGGLGPFDYFHTQMSRFSNEESVFGPVSLKGLEEDRYRVCPDGYLPTARIAFVDEAFKANAAILNALLWIMNERKWRNDGAIVSVPLWTMGTASNEMPEGEELNALFDRITFRHQVRRIQEPGNFIKMLKLQMAPTPTIILDWADIEQAHAEASDVEVPQDVLEALNSVRTDLRTQGIEPTDRRLKDSLSIIQAAAWLDGQTVADIEHLRPLAHVLWTTPDQAPIVERLLLELANPLDREAMNLLETVEGLAVELDKVLADKTQDPTMRNKKGVELHNKVERAKEDLSKLVRQVEASKRKSAKLAEVRGRLLTVAQRLLTEIFKVDADVAGDF